MFTSLLWYGLLPAPTIKSKPAKDAITFVSTDTIPEVRTVVSNKPVASYFVGVNDPKLNRRFGLNIYETPSTFKYLLRM